jgi:putative endonuclease
MLQNPERMATLLRIIVKRLENIRRRFGNQTVAAHIETAHRGELQAYLYLRQHGYRILERNLRERGHHGEIDLIGWHNGTLCFVEVKTRIGEQFTPPEAAVDSAKKHHLRAVARRYMRRLGKTVQTARFDIVSVTYPAADREPEIRLIKNAFGWSSRLSRAPF